MCRLSKIGRDTPLFFLVLLIASSTLAAQDATAPGTATAPYPTLNNISIDWPIAGDANKNGVVNVRYREAGQTAWKIGHPLFRVPAGSRSGHSWNNRHTGSLFELRPDTSYEVELVLSDPDGGGQTQTLTADTRPWPISAEQGMGVTPATINDALNNLAAGDVLVLGNGNYGGINVGQNGTGSAPIVIRAANPGGAIVQGDVRMDGQEHVHIVGLTVEGQIKFNNAANIVVRDCTIDTTRDGIVSYSQGVSNALVIGNTITGATQWNEAALGNSGNNIGEGIVMTGPGNVIAFNRIDGFRDGISLVEDSGAFNQQSIDIFGNELLRCADDGIEADFAMGNVRVYHNRLTDCFMGISSQPSLGGPTWFIRNVMYNIVLSPFKLQRSSVGDVAYHNTVIKTGDAFGVRTSDVFSRTRFRNNLFIGGAPGGTFNGFNIGSGSVMHLPSADSSCDFDYDGFGSIGTGTFAGRVGNVFFNDLAELRQLTSETNAIQVDLSTFAGSVAIPTDPVVTHAPVDTSLATNGAAVDAGVPISGVNDGFLQSAPDLGACEAGASKPVYGPGGYLVGTAVVFPEGHQVLRGDIRFGSHIELGESDNIDFSISRNLSEVQSRVSVALDSTSPFAEPISIVVTVEASVFARTNVVQSVDLFDFDSNQWEQVGSMDARKFFDSIQEINPTGDLSRFVEPGSRRIEARIRFDSPVSRQRFSANIDFVQWTIER